ncbi:HTH-type transcriptional regulator GltR [Alicyclobacillus contaminans]|nr:HTH-type transcriptional regulator GltR [Alicyclobacillus contaminans]
MSLTPSGETLLRYAARILNLCREAEQAVQDTDTPRGPLRIGAMETTTAIRLPAILAKYHQRFPDVQLALTTGSTRALLDAVLNYELEAAFVAGPIEHELLVTAAVIEEELVLVSKAGEVHGIQSSQPMTVLAFREGCSYRQRMEQYLDAMGIVSRTVIELGTLDGILGCVAAGLGIAMVPKAVVDQSRHPLTAHAVPEAFRSAPTVLVHRRDAFVSPALTQFTALVRQI